ncbi:MAG TPA: GatB/YqeY domain-containing protein [Armatimonadota bacterium]|jgi:hypothetical protein
MPLILRLNDDLKASMRSGDTVRRDTIRLLISSLKLTQIDHKGELDEETEARVVAKEVKQRKDSIAEYRKAGRDDLADREQAELDILGAYMPAQMTADEIRALVMAAIDRTGATGPADLGRVMKDAVPAAKGRADGSVINSVAREILMSTSG